MNTRNIVTIAIGLFIASTSFAQTVEQMREAALSACSSQVAQLPADQQALVKRNCECVVNKTDYEKVLRASQSGDIAGIQNDALDAARECAEGGAASAKEL